MNTFTDMEWGSGAESPELFNPAELDCRQWARVCKEAGMKAGDRITAIDSTPINSTADLSLVMWDKQRGDTINIDTLRKRLLLPDKPLNYELTLQ